MAGRIGRIADAATGPERLDAGGETERLAVVGVIERLDAERVAGQEQRALGVVPDREGEHAAQPASHRRAFAVIELKDDFGVGLGREARAFLDQLGAERFVIVDLAVEGDPQRHVGAGLGREGHGLGGFGAKINNGEAAMTKPDPPVVGDPQAGPVGTAFRHGVADPLELGRIDRTGSRPVGEDRRDPAHGGVHTRPSFAKAKGFVDPALPGRPKSG